MPWVFSTDSMLLETHSKSMEYADFSEECLTSQARLKLALVDIVLSACASPRSVEGLLATEAIAAMRPSAMTRELIPCAF